MSYCMSCMQPLSRCACYSTRPTEQGPSTGGEEPNFDEDPAACGAYDAREAMKGAKEIIRSAAPVAGAGDDLPARIRQYLTWEDCGPGEHSDKVGANAFELLEEAANALSQQPAAQGQVTDAMVERFMGAMQGKILDFRLYWSNEDKELVRKAIQAALSQKGGV